MKNSGNEYRRSHLISRMSSLASALKTLALRSPESFRRRVIVEHSGRRFNAVMQRWQRDDFEALDPAWRRLAGRPRRGGNAPLQRAWIERPRGHSKTTDLAVQAAWVALASRRKLQGVVAAADREQAQLLRDAIERIVAWNPRLCSDLAVRRDRILNLRTRSRIDFIASDVGSSWGLLPDFVICDELCHWEHEELWHSLVSSAAKRPDCVLVVLTNAGAGCGWQWQLREHALSSPEWHFSSLDGPCAPWIGEEALEEQRRILPPPVFERLWLNRWQHSDGAFVTLAEAEACRDDWLTMQDLGEPGRLYVAAIDYAEKRDNTVGCVCHYAGGRVVVDRMDVVSPGPGRPTPVRWVEEWIRRIARDFHTVRFVVDEYQLLSVIQQYSATYAIERFPFGGSRGNHALAVNLRNLIINRRVAWYANCGQIHSAAGRDDLETELASLIVKTRPGDRLRFDHVNDGVHHDDRAFTLGVACLELMKQNHGGDFLHVSSPEAGGGFLA